MFYSFISFIKVCTNIFVDGAIIITFVMVSFNIYLNDKKIIIYIIIPIYYKDIISVLLIEKIREKILDIFFLYLIVIFVKLIESLKFLILFWNIKSILLWFSFLWMSIPLNIFRTKYNTSILLFAHVILNKTTLWINITLPPIMISFIKYIFPILSNEHQ